MQEAVVGFELLDFTILHIPMHMEVLSEFSMLIIAPAILKKVDVIDT